MNQLQPSSSTPVWIKYLVGAFPHAGLSELTPIVLQSHYADVDPAVMLDAVKAYVEVGKFWPTVAELRKHVAEAQRKHEAASAEELHMDWRQLQSYKAASPQWVLCPDCGEYKHVTWIDCRYCEDMVTAL